MKRLIVSLASFAAVLSLAVAAALPASAAGGMANGRQVATHGTPVVMAVDGARLIKGPFGMLHTAGLTAKTCNGSTATWFHLTIWVWPGRGLLRCATAARGKRTFRITISGGAVRATIMEASSIIRMAGERLHA